MSDGTASATTSETTSPVDAVANAVRGRKAPPTAEQRAEMARKAKNRRFAEKLKKAKTDAEAAALSREYQRSLGAEPDEPEPEAQPEPETQARPVVAVDDSGWPDPAKTAACMEGAVELWSIGRDMLGDTRYAECLKPRHQNVPEQVGVDASGAPVVELKDKLVDPVAQLAKPTAALMAKSDAKLSPGWALVVVGAMVFGPTAVRHLGELGAAVYLKMQAKKQRAEPLAEQPPTGAVTAHGLTVVAEPKAGTA